MEKGRGGLSWRRVLALCLNVKGQAKVIDSVKVASSGAGVVDVDDVRCLINEAQGPVDLDPGLIMCELVVAFGCL